MPKFKVGDWVILPEGARFFDEKNAEIYKSRKVFQVSEIRGDGVCFILATECMWTAEELRHAPPLLLAAGGVTLLAVSEPE